METNELNQIFCNCWECETAPGGVSRKALIKMILNSGKFERPSSNLDFEPEPEPEEEVIQAEPVPQQEEGVGPLKLSDKDYIVNETHELLGSLTGVAGRTFRKKWVIKNLNNNDFRKIKRNHNITGRCQVWECDDDKWVILVKTTTESTPNLDLISLSPQ
tara:strand:- start:205 stop:684 length:480 start_codon:yes stop_codon:yes gene_type:complete